MSGTQGGVLVVGSVNADLVVTVARRPGAGETVLGSDLATFPGGKGANQGVAAARLGARVAFAGRVGTDSFARFLRAGLDREGVDTRHLQAVPGPSGGALITVDPAGDNSIIVAPGANARLDAAGVAAALGGPGGPAVVSAQLEVPVEAVAEAARLAGARGGRGLGGRPPPGRGSSSTCPRPGTCRPACSPPPTRWSSTSTRPRSCSAATTGLPRSGRPRSSKPGRCSRSVRGPS